MRTPRIVIALLIVCGLVVLALQNDGPVLPLVFLGGQTLALPLGVWLSAAIALGMVTAIAISILANSRQISGGRTGRRQWTVSPETPPPYGSRQPSGFRTAPEPMRSPPPPEWSSTDGGQRPSAPPPSTSQAAENWQTWEQRSSPRQWEDWSQASGNDPLDDTLTKRQRRDRQKAAETIQDLDKGWDDSAQETVYVAPGGSAVADALDEIEDGWEDWDSDDNPLADTAYSNRYEGREKTSRRDSIYSPPDDMGGSDDDSVYDADYRVIIPPYRPLEEDENRGDRSV